MRVEGCHQLWLERLGGKYKGSCGLRDKCPVSSQQSGTGQVSQSNICLDKSVRAIRDNYQPVRGGTGHSQDTGRPPSHFTHHTWPCLLVKLLNGIAGDLIRKLKSTTWASVHNTAISRIKDIYNWFAAI